jgi:hypothetical protein
MPAFTSDAEHKCAQAAFSQWWRSYLGSGAGYPSRVPGMWHADPHVSIQRTSFTLVQSTRSSILAAPSSREVVGINHSIPCLLSR